MLIEAARHPRKAYRNPGLIMRNSGNSRRPRLGPAVSQGTAGSYQRWQAFTARRERPVVANVAIARELAGWIWSLAVLDPSALFSGQRWGLGEDAGNVRGEAFSA